MSDGTGWVPRAIGSYELVVPVADSPTGSVWRERDHALDREAPIRAGLARMRDRGDLRPDTDTDALALALLTALQGGLLLTQTRRNTTPLRTCLDAVLAHIRTHAPEATHHHKRSCPAH